MYISKVHVKCVKSYFDSGEVEFRPGFNIVVGANSAEKTALLEAIQMLGGIAHRSSKTVPFVGAGVDCNPSVRLTFGLDKTELLRILRNSDFYCTQPERMFSFPGCERYEGDEDDMRAFLQWLFTQPEYKVTVESRNGGYTSVENRFNLYPAANQVEKGRELFIKARCNENEVTFVGTEWGQPSSDVTLRIAASLRQRIYRFLAERFNFGDSPVGTNAVLRPNAGNLPEVLDLLNANPIKMDRFNRLVCEILPQVKQISVTKSAINGPISARILVWPDVRTERDDLAHPLNECGSGVGQVLAIIYVAMNPEPQVILIDEPQSFLHPGAVRKLIEVLKGFPQHQYIIATHSPAIITASDPVTISTVRSAEGESKIEVIDPKSTNQARTLLAELGARLADVFGADNIVWVEGHTEEECFPAILRRIAGRSLMGTAIVGIRRTGDLQGRDKLKWMDLHRKLAEGNSVIPPTIAFGFDSECLTEAHKNGIRKLSPNRVHFLPRRMYENYLLDADAIASVANEIPGFRDNPISPEEVREWLEEKHKRRKEKNGSSKLLRYFCEGHTTVPAEWEQVVDAGSLLKDLFQELSETRVSFDKTTHSVELTEWLIEHKPAALKEVADFVVSLVGAGAQGANASAEIEDSALRKKALIGSVSGLRM